MNAHQLQFTHSALIQTGYCVYGTGLDDAGAREDAAQWLDDGETAVESFPDMVSMRRTTAHGDLAIVPCTEAFADYVSAHGTTTWEETDDGICLPSELK